MLGAGRVLLLQLVETVRGERLVLVRVEGRSGSRMAKIGVGRKVSNGARRSAAPDVRGRGKRGRVFAGQVFARMARGDGRCRSALVLTGVAGSKMSGGAGGRDIGRGDLSARRRL